MRTLIYFLLIIFAFAAYSQSPDKIEAAAKKMDQFLDRFPDLGPGYAVVIVTADKVISRNIRGLRRASSRDKLTADTPIYIASQTKAYVGLLAARLDKEGILSLNDRITDHWPDVEFPEGVEPGDWTLKDLLAHNVPIESEYITYMEAYVTELAASDYPALIARHGVKRDPGHQYDNIGYNIWGAILHKATGQSWRYWLDKKLFHPLDMKHTSSRTSDFSLNKLSWNHIWQGDSAGWFEVRPKTDAMMQSAGGLVTSPNDIAKWLQLNLGGKVATGAGITPQMIHLAHTPAADTDPKARNPYELPCSAYALGWNICDFEGNRLFIHGGGYTGARTMMAFSPDLGAGIAVFSNSDNMTGWLTSRTMVQFFQYLTDHEDADRMADVRERVYPQRIQRLLDHRRKQLAEKRADPIWENWSWQPGPDMLRQFAGTYNSDDPYRKVSITVDGKHLVAKMGGLSLQLTPAKKDLFGGFTTPFSGPDAITFQRDAAGSISGFMWDGRIYSLASGKD